MSYKKTIQKGSVRFDIDFNLDDGLNKFKKVSKDQNYKGKANMGLQLLNNIMNGSPRESVVPPIKTGLLRGSGSVFVGSKLVGESPKVNGKGQPNKQYSDKESVITVGIDVNYAAKLHEQDFNPGAVSQQSGDVGNKFVERHLKADKDDLMKLYAKQMKKRLDSNK